MIRKVLLVDPDLSSQEQCARVLRDCRCEVAVADSATAALTQLGKRKFDVAVLDFRLATLNDGNVVSAARHAQPEIKIILAIDAMSGDPADSLLQLRGYTLLTKPLRIEELARALEAVPETPTLKLAPTKPKPHTAAEEYASMVGSSERMKKIFRLVSKVATQRHVVLIMGESGTGKELVARAIHSQGPWRDHPFVPVDCGALPPTLIESELFGHVKGSFTGATQSRRGLLASAGSGTVFLDEIGELPIELQSRLLRALQEHEIRPLGSNERTKFEARIVAATNQDLEAQIKNGSFRKDLYFRLNVVTIKIPSLRDRKEDIPTLARNFLERYATSRPAMKISDEAMTCLMAYPWPGNVRELENCMQRVVSLGSGKYIQPTDLPSPILYIATRKSSNGEDFGTLQALEQQAIRDVLKTTGGDRIRTAKVLGIGKTTIYRKLKEYGIEFPDTQAAEA
jgi:DNA-binding NtrC family response regulator